LQNDYRNVLPALVNLKNLSVPLAMRSSEAYLLAIELRPDDLALSRMARLTD
jgi:hypothetical protein